MRSGAYGNYRIGCAMTFEQIGARIGCSPSTAASAYVRGIEKLKRRPGALEGLLEIVRASASGERDPLQPGSVECNGEFIRLFGA